MSRIFSSPDSVAQVVLLGLLFIPILTKLWSTLQFRHRQSVDSKNRTSVPLVPYWMPGVFHLFPFLWDTVSFIVSTIVHHGWQKPVMVKAANTRLVLVGNPEHVTGVFKNSRFLSTRFIIERVQRLLVGIPPETLPLYTADNSGMAAEPRKASKVAQEDRILFHQAHTHHKWLASPYLEPIAESFLRVLHEGISVLEIGESWVEYPDLYRFMRLIIVRANIEATLGSKVLELNPSLVEDFCDAATTVPKFLNGWPRWLAPKGFKARDRVIKALEKWHAYANVAGDYNSTRDGDPEWDAIWGSKCEKIRQQYMNGTKRLTPYARACEDWGFLIGLNYNTPPSIFWYIFESLRDTELNARMTKEALECCSPDGSISISALAAQPLLESAYAEVLRLRVSIVMTRTVEYGDLNIAGYEIPRGDVVLMPTDAMHFNKELWARAGKPADKPITKFDPDRFLEPSETGPKFSTDKLAGLWIPYGGGDRMCPGRHLVKLEMLSFYAYMFSKYEIQADEGDMKKVGPNRHYVSFGVLPPDRTVRFKIRKRVETRAEHPSRDIH
ncbi:cytochrome P450 [Nemania abortiva]|nr:cytochrome P450 [Nemania abortiva]